MTISYDRIKNWCRDHKKEMTVSACFVLIFLVGFGTGRYDRGAQNLKRRAQSNYTKSPDNQQKAGTDATTSQDQLDKGQVAGQTTGNDGAAVGKNQTKNETNCLIKGNISTKGDKIYHVKGGAFYDRTNPELCFNSESEAKAAGFRKSSR